MTTTIDNLGKFGSRVKEVVTTWTSDGDGAATETTMQACCGLFIGARFIPGSADAQPTDGYTVKIETADGEDVLGGNGAALSNTLKQYRPSLVTNAVADPDALSPNYVPVNSPLTIKVTGAGAAKQGTIKFYFLEM